MDDAKLFLGHKLKALRDERRLTQADLAGRLGLSLSYVSQLENNQRPVTATVLVALSRAFGIDVGEFAEDDHERIVADLRETLGDPIFAGQAPGLQEIKQVAATAPNVARSLIVMHRETRRLRERLRAVDDSLASPDGGQEGALLPYEEVRDYFHYHNNYVDGLDRAAELMAEQIGIGGEDNGRLLADVLRRELDVRVAMNLDDPSAQRFWRFDRSAGVIAINPALDRPSIAFLLAHQVGLLRHGREIDAIVAGSELVSADARAICRIALANYFAGALLMPYGRFLQQARELRHDLERLQLAFGTSLQQVAHRLSTLQRPSARGVPFFFVRVDQAGNITKRHSATSFQFARFGGTCPLWNVHQAFVTPGRFLVQLAEMPDGKRYLCIARSVVKRGRGYLEQDRRYAIGLGCEFAHAGELVYASGLDLDDARSYVKIGVNCRICERVECPQRAFPPIDRAILLDPSRRDAVPYAF
ncbi:MAG: short-chain fatty acyl-CoA regulator family protein [Alphaproteobacteria bacterium]